MKKKNVSLFVAEESLRRTARPVYTVHAVHNKKMVFTMKMTNFFIYLLEND